MTRRAKELAELLTSVVHAPTAWVVSIGVFTTEARRNTNAGRWLSLKQCIPSAAKLSAEKLMPGGGVSLSG
jgi:hypothetical protein